MADTNPDSVRTTATNDDDDHVGDVWCDKCAANFDENRRWTGDKGICHDCFVKVSHRLGLL